MMDPSIPCTKAVFLTPKQRYDLYWTWCVILGVRPLTFTGWLWESEKVPERLPIAWTQSSASL